MSEDYYIDPIYSEEEVSKEKKKQILRTAIETGVIVITVLLVTNIFKEFK